MIRPMKNNGISKHLMLTFKGMAMGACDLVPGVSGGTIAFITGIYEKLIQSIRSFNGTLLKMLWKGQMASAWHHIGGNFLLAVVVGIAISLFTLANLMGWLLQHHAMVVWSFFFGLILGSAIYVGRKITRWHILSIALLLAGGALAYAITLATPATTPETWWFIFISGSIAMCALILPGISGAFILILLGKYEFMLQALRQFQVDVVLIFLIGGATGIMAFSHLIGWLFKKHPNATLALLSGFMIGSLNKLWPWKEVTSWRINSLGEEVPLLEKSIMPGHYEMLYGQDPRVLVMLLAALGGMALILIFAGLAGSKSVWQGQPKSQINE